MRLGLALAGLLAAASPAAAGPPASPAADRVDCAGGETLAPIARAWAGGVAAHDPSVSVTIDDTARLAADGFRDLLEGHANCALFVREPFPSEEAAFRARFGHAPLLVPVAMGSFATRGGTHAIAIYVNAANPIRGLTLSQLRAAFSAGSQARTWGDLGLTGAWATRPVHLYGMIAKRPSGEPPGVVNFFERRVLQGASLRPDIAEQVDRPGEQALAAIVAKVAADPDGMGYSGFGYAEPGARTVPVARHARGPYVAGSPATVADAAYPLARRIYILVDKPPGRPLPPGLRAFLLYALSAPGQAALAADPEGFLPLPPAEAARARALLR